MNQIEKKSEQASFSILRYINHILKENDRKCLTLILNHV